LRVAEAGNTCVCAVGVLFASNTFDIPGGWFDQLTDKHLSGSITRLKKGWKGSKVVAEEACHHV
jgi:hypothetical protein